MGEKSLIGLQKTVMGLVIKTTGPGIYMLRRKNAVNFSQTGRFNQTDGTKAEITVCLYM